MRDEKLILCCASRGNDLYYKIPIYTLNQTKKFKHLNYVTAQNGNMPAEDQLLFGMLKYDFDYIHHFDGDVGLPYDASEKLVECGKDVVCSPVWHYVFQQDIHLNVHYSPKFERHCKPKPSGLEPIYASSMSSLMLSRRVIETFVNKKESFQHWSPLLPESMRNNPWDNIFFAKLHMLGFQPYMCWDVEVGEHHRMVLLSTTTLAAFTKGVVDDYGREQKVAN